MPHLLHLESLDLAGLVQPGDTVMWGQANAEPLPLTQALMAQRHKIGRFRVMLGIANTSTCKPEHADRVDFISYCGAGANRELADAGLLQVLPSHYSELPELITSGALRIDVLMLQLAPANAEGRYSLSIASEYLLPALDSARLVIAEINAQAPWTYADRTLTDDDLDAIVFSDRAPMENAVSPIRESARQIANHIAGLVEDGATLQMGIGAIPDAVLSALAEHRHLGVHSGSLGDGVARLMQSGAITNQRKPIDRGISVGGILMGSSLLHRYAHNNPSLQLRSTRYTHDAHVLASLDKLVAINSAVEVDLTGQVNSECAAGSYIGAVGGLIDFIRGARASRGGLTIIALPSTAGAQSRIVTKLSGPVTVARSDAVIVVTEHGVADLRGLTLDQRTRKLLQIAHPDHRTALQNSAH